MSPSSAATAADQHDERPRRRDQSDTMKRPANGVLERCGRRLQRVEA